MMKTMEWLSGAMERHSDQQRQIAAHKAGIKMIWWEVAWDFPPFDCEHKQENLLKELEMTHESSGAEPQYPNT